MPASARSEVIAPDGVRLMVAERPGAGRPIVLLHGLFQSHLAWLDLWDEPALAGFHLVAPDLRGHGGSDKPDQPDAYRQADRWAGDIEQLISGLGLVRPIVVAWSYGGRVIGDYLDLKGDGAIGGCVFVAATLRTVPEHFAADLGTLFAEIVADDPVVEVGALRRFAAAVAPAPLDRQREEGLIAAASVPKTVRRHLLGRPADYSSSLQRLSVPVRVLHGTQDRVVTPAQSEWTASACRVPCTLWQDAGHAPFLEHPRRFAEDLAAFASG